MKFLTDQEKKDFKYCYDVICKAYKFVTYQSPKSKTHWYDSEIQESLK